MFVIHVAVFFGARHTERVPLFEYAFAGFGGFLGVVAAAGGNTVGQWHKYHTAGVEVFVRSASFVYAEEAADDETVHHIHDRFTDGAVHGFIGINTFLDNDFADFQTFFDFCHFIAVFTVQSANFIGGFNAHHAHAVSACVGFDNHERLVGNTQFIVFGLNFCQHALYRAC